MFILKEVKPFPNSKIIKLLTFDKLFPLLLDAILAKTGSTMRTAISCSRRNDAGSRAHYLVLRNLVLVVVLVSESKAPYYKFTVSFHKL